MTSTRKKKATPPLRWADEPFQRFIDYTEEQEKLLAVTIKGISAFHGMPRLLEALHSLRDESEVAGPEDKTWQKIKVAREQAEFAKKQVETKFSDVYASASVNMWTALETLVYDLFYASLKNDSGLMQQKPFSEVRVQVGDFVTLSDDQRTEVICREVEKLSKATYRPGIAKFESLLETIGLDGRVNKKTRRDIFELYHVRNLYVHKRGVVDFRFRENCPWKRTAVGNVLRINPRDYWRYANSSYDYVFLVINRTRRKFGFRAYRHKKTS